jgi:hypothetical protein
MTNSCILVYEFLYGFKKFKDNLDRRRAKCSRGKMKFFVCFKYSEK